MNASFRPGDSGAWVRIPGQSITHRPTRSEPAISRLRTSYAEAVEGRMKSALFAVAIVVVSAGVPLAQAPSQNAPQTAG